MRFGVTAAAIETAQMTAKKCRFQMEQFDW
jgi:hypothetical protein